MKRANGSRLYCKGGTELSHVLGRSREGSQTAAMRRSISGESKTAWYWALVQRRLARVWMLVAMHTESNFSRSCATMFRSSCAGRPPLRQTVPSLKPGSKTS